jgi:uroporphyrinogen decarboxylase
LQHCDTDRVPIALVCSGINPPAYRDLDAYLQRRKGISVQAFLDPLVDIRNVAPAYIGPRLVAGTDIWGVHRQPVSYGAGHYQEISRHPLASLSTPDQLNAHRWPTTDWFDYSALTRAVAAAREEGDHCLMVANGNIFETSWYMRGFEQLFMDFVVKPDLAHGILERVFTFFLEHFTLMLREVPGEIDLVFTADDIGGQQGLLMSPEMWEGFIKPYHRRLNERIHELGARVIYHSDGAVMQAVPGLLDMGIDVLQALQFDAKGMDPNILKRDFGDRLCFQGGISVQKTLPFGTAEDVRKEVCERIAVLGRNGGYILGPSHCIQAGTPPENIVTMFETAASLSRC